MAYKSVLEFTFDNEGWKYSAGSHEVVEYLPVTDNNYLNFCGLEKEYKDVTFEDVKPLLDKIFDLTIDNVMNGIDQGEFKDWAPDGKLYYDVVFRNIRVYALDEYADTDRSQSKRLPDRYERHAVIDMNNKKVLTKDSINESEDNYVIKSVKGHFEILKNYKFFASADTLREADEIIEEDKKECAMRRKNSTRDSVELVGYDSGYDPVEGRQMYSEEYELAAYSDRTHLEIDPEDIWVDPYGDQISFEEALDDIMESAVELKPDDPDYIKTVKEQKWEEYGENPADYKILKVTIGNKQEILVTYEGEKLGRNTDNMEDILNGLGYKQLDINDISIDDLLDKERENYYNWNFRDSKVKDSKPLKSDEQYDFDTVEEGLDFIDQYDFPEKKVVMIGNPDEDFAFEIIKIDPNTTINVYYDGNRIKSFANNHKEAINELKNFMMNEYNTYNFADSKVKDSEERKYYFSAAKHAHDIDYYDNRLSNLVHEAYYEDDESAGVILAKKYGDDFIDALDDFRRNQLYNLWSAINFNSNGKISMLTGPEIGLAKEVVAWADGQRSGASGRLDVGPAWKYAKKFIKSGITKDSKTKDINPINYQNEVKQKWIEELKDIGWISRVLKYRKVYEIGPFEIHFNDNEFYAIDKDTQELFGFYDRLYKLCDELIKNIKSNNDGFRRVYKQEDEPKNKFSLVNDSNKKPGNAPLRVCTQCLMAIESHEGPQITHHVWVDENDKEDSKCDWCEEDGFDELYEILDSTN